MEVDTNDLLSGFKEKYFTDVDFSRWLRKNGWEGDYSHVMELCRFTVEDKTLAVVKYRNSHPCNRFIFINTNLVKK